MAELDHGEVVVIGAGVSGLSAGWWLAKAGVDVIVLDKGVVGWEASGRNGGGFASWVEWSPSKARMGLLTLDLWQTLDEELGYPTEFTYGIMGVTFDEEGVEAQRESYETDIRRGVDVQLLDLPAIKEMAPLISDEILGGIFWPTGGHANPQRTVQAYAWALQDLGGRIYQNATVTGITVSGDKVTAVETTRGTVKADFVVSAAGPQTTLICEMVGAYVPVAPGRVEIVVTEPLPLMPMGKISGNALYGRQTRRGNLTYGGGNPEWLDVNLETPDKSNTPMIRNIARRLTELFPAAADLRIIRSWGGVVEQTPDMSPVIDTLDHPTNFVVATLSADGFGISPATGKVIRDLVLHGESPELWGELNANRFRDVPPDWREGWDWATPAEPE